MSTSAKNQVACPICNGHYSKLGINAHVNSCLSALERTEENENTTGQSCQDDGSPPHKQAKLESNTISSAIKPPDGATHKQPRCINQSQSMTAKQDHQTGYSPKKTTSTSGTRNAFSLMTWNKTPPSKLSSSGPKESPRASRLDPESPKKEDTPSYSWKGKETQLPPKNILGLLSSKTVVPPTLPSRGQDGNNNRARSSRSKNTHQPLAERMRPLQFNYYVGQEHVIGRGKMLRELLMSDSVPSMIVWGPPGCGKTTLARIIASRCKEKHDTRFVQLSATTSGIADVKEVIKIAKNEQKMMKRKTILFVDEIHRFNKLQQDSFLPHVEDGTIILIGATTENPSFHVNNALLSRCKVLVLEKLTASHIEEILLRAITELGGQVIDKGGQVINKGGQVMDKGQPDLINPDSDFCLCVDKAAVMFLALHCDGDARAALNVLQATVETKKLRQQGAVRAGERSMQGAAQAGDKAEDGDKAQGNVCGERDVISVDDMKEGLDRSHVQYDKTGEEHYNCASALQKSVRGSDDNAAIYWMTRMLEGGEDPMFIARRLVVCASEDIGLADPHALPLAVACQQACHLIGKPECAINLAHCVTYLARAPKSNESYMGLSRARASIRDHEGPLPGVPLHLRNAPTRLMKNIGYGSGYKYNHDYQNPVQQEYLPSELQGVNFFSGD